VTVLTKVLFPASTVIEDDESWDYDTLFLSVFSGIWISFLFFSFFDV